MKMRYMNDMNMAPSELIINGECVYEATEEQYREAGYYPIVEAEYPNDGKLYDEKYTFDGERYIMEWEEQKEEHINKRVEELESALVELAQMLLI